MYNRKKHKIVFVEGLYVLLDKEPWNQLQTLFDFTYFVGTSPEVTVNRLFRRMTTQMGLTKE